MKALYKYDVNTNVFAGVAMVSDSYVPQAGETFLKPEDGLYEPITHLVDGKGQESWIGTSKEEWEKANPGTPAKPDPSRQVIMSQQSDITQLQKMVMTQQAEIAQLKKGSN